MSMTAVFICLLLLQLKHLIADFIVQPESWFSTKYKYSGRGGILHASVHAVMTFAVLVLCSHGLILSLMVSIVEGVTHHFIDWRKASMVQARALNTEHKFFWWLFGIDQALHQITYLAIVWFLYMQMLPVNP